jgi:hypothetical protein
VRKTTVALFFFSFFPTSILLEIARKVNLFLTLKLLGGEKTPSALFAKLVPPTD